MNKIKLKCSFCGFNLLKSNYKEPTFHILLDGELGTICYNCYKKYYLRYKKCDVCGKKINYALYFISDKKDFKLLCTNCYREAKKKWKKEEK